MPRLITHRFRVFVALPVHGGGGDLPGLLDMLRYEGGRVIAWDGHKDARDRDGYTVTIEVRSDLGSPAPDRWRSFGIVVEPVA